MQEQQNDEPAPSEQGLNARVQAVLAGLIEAPLSPGLYVVATPIGNLGDISLRALAVLARADLIAAEDTRHSRKLLSHYGIGGRLAPYHEHNAAKERPHLLARIRAGAAVALISDAGTPLVSDPGYKLVRAALDEGFSVTSIPGPSAALAALSSAGLPTDSFFFAGFLPPKSGQRQKRLEALKSVPATLIFFETAPRLGKALADMHAVLGPREAVLAKELTKLHERLARGALDELATQLANEPEPRGEYVVLVAPPGAPEQAGEEEIVTALKTALETASFRDAVRDVAQAFGASRAQVYELGLKLERNRGR